jgi:uroporphyrinogen-III synthase
VDKPLAGVTVVVTRPVHQAEKLCQLIESRGGNVLRFPTLEITAPGNQAILAEIIQRLADFNIAIFISPNAVEWGMKFIHKTGQLPTQLKIAAVGQGTANKLSALARPADIFPTEQFNSEALLAMDELGDVSGKHIVIFRGEGGRESGCHRGVRRMLSTFTTQW